MSATDVRARCASGDDFIEFRPSGCRNQALVGGICAAIPLAGTFHGPQQRAEGKHSKRMKCTKVVKKNSFYCLFCFVEHIEQRERFHHSALKGAKLLIHGVGIPSITNRVVPGRAAGNLSC